MPSVYRPRRPRASPLWQPKRNFQVFDAVDFLAATVEHIPLKGQHTVRYDGLYSNKSRRAAAVAARQTATKEWP